MKRTRFLTRIFFLLLIISVLFYLNRKSGVNLDTITRFKLETMNKMQADSLDTKHKFDLLVKETTKFNEKINEDSSHAQEAINFLIGLVIIFIISELFFLRKGSRTFTNNE
jgi:hypothetical protein